MAFDQSDSEAQLRDFIENSKDLIQVVDPSGKLLFANRAWRETLGYFEGEIEGIDLFSVMASDCRDKCADLMRRLMLGEDVGTVEVAFLSKAGQRIELEGNVNVRTQNGVPVSTRGIFRDVTEKRKREQENEARIQRKLHFQSALLSMRDFETGDLDDYFREVTSIVARTLGLELTSVWLFDEARTRIECKSAHERGKASRNVGTVLQLSDCPEYFQAISSGELMVADDVRTHPATAGLWASYMQPNNIASTLDVPLQAHGELLGVLCCEQIGQIRKWSTEDCEFADAASGYLMLAIQRDERRKAELRIREQEIEVRKLALVAAKTDNAVVLADTAGMIVWVNEGFTHLTGYTLHDVRGRKPGTFLQGPETDPATVRRIHERLHLHQGFVEEILNYRKDGSKYWVNLEVQPMLDEHGRLTNYMSIQRDITGVREARTSLEEHAWALEKRVQERTAELDRSQQQFQALFEFAPDAIVMGDKSGHIRLVNRQAEQMFGWKREEIIGQPVETLIPMARREDHKRLREAYATDAMKRSSVQRPNLWGLRKDGTEFPAEISLSPLETPEGVMTAAAIRDITERKQGEQSVLESERSLKEAQRMSHIGNWELNHRTGQLKWSDEIFRIFELDPRQFHASYDSFLDLIHPEDREAVNQAYKDSLKTRTPYSIQHRLKMKDGRIKFVQEQCETTYDNSGTPIISAGTVQDITERIQVERQLEESNTLLKQITDNIHEVFWMYDHREGRIIYVSPGYERIWGRKIEALYSNNAEFIEGIAPEDRGILLNSMEQQKRGEHSEAEYRVIRPDGSFRWVLDRSFPLRDEARNLIRTTGIATDITEAREAERELLLSESSKRAYWESALDAIITVNQEEKITDLNPSAIRMFGYSREELIGQRLSTRLMLQRSPESLSSGIPSRQLNQVINLIAIRRDGTEFPVELTMVEIHDAQTGSGLICSIRDVTERTQHQRRLNLQNEVLKRIAEAMPLETVLDTLCQQVESFREQSVCSVMQLTPDGNLKLIAAPSLSKQAVPLRAVLRAGAGNGSCGTAAYTGKAAFVCDTTTDPRWENARVLASQLGIQACWSVPIYDGDCIFGTFAISHPVQREPHEQDRHLIEEGSRLAGIAIQRHRTQIALAESEAHFRTLADSGQALIWTSNTEQKGEYFNKPWLQFTGRQLKEELGDGWQQGIHKDDLEKCLKRYAEAFERRESFTMVYRLRRADGEYRWIEDHGTPRQNIKGDFIGYIGHCLDITDRLAAEKQLNRSQRLEAIGQLAGGVAHDLNNALSPILMTSSLLKMQNPDSADIIETMEASTRRCADMVRQLLTFARGAEGERLLIQPKHLLKEMDKIIRGTFPKNIELKIFTDADLSTVLGDATQLHQVLLNLCVNARDAMPNGGKLTLRAENVLIDASYASATPDAKPGPYVLLEVADNGTGIPPEIIDRILEPFFTTKGPDKGTGLGLSTVVGIVKGHGGFLRIQSELGAGSKFMVHLPASTNEYASRTREQGSSTPAISGKGLTVLVVDDESSVRNSMQTVLKGLEFEVITANDGTEALLVATEKRNALHLIITDLHMPYMGGIQLVRTLKRILPAAAILVTSGRFDKHDEVELRAMGITNLLPKPFTQEKLVELLHSTLSRPVAK